MPGVLGIVIKSLPVTPLYSLNILYILFITFAI